MAFQAPHTERSFARQEAHWQRNTMQPLSIVMIVIWSFWRAKLGQSSSPAARVRYTVGARALDLQHSSLPAHSFCLRGDIWCMKAGWSTAIACCQLSWHMYTCHL